MLNDSVRDPNRLLFVESCISHAPCPTPLAKLLRRRVLVHVALHPTVNTVVGPLGIRWWRGLEAMVATRRRRATVVSINGLPVRHLRPRRWWCSLCARCGASATTAGRPDAGQDGEGEESANNSNNGYPNIAIAVEPSANLV